MENFLSLPAEVIETIDVEGLFLVTGGDNQKEENVNNQGEMCSGKNNQGKMCSGINNQGKESKVQGSRLTKDVIELIRRNIVSRYNTHPFRTLKISFFGGEPFMDFNGIRQILNFTQDFCDMKGVCLYADFTTNATLINNEIVKYLSSFNCSFQITLDGDRSRHNKIKYSIDNPSIDTYSKALETLHTINSEIERRHISVRINFDNHTLHKIDEIIRDISFLDRRKSMVILKKVWQIESESVDHDLLLKCIQKFIDADFFLDYYVIPKGSVCFADRESQVLFNFDGKIFKCITISDFDDYNSLGKVNKDDGTIIWDKEKMSDWMDDKQPEYCKKCKWFPVCLGICNRQLIAHPNERLCNIEGLTLSQDEYLLYLFKVSLLRNKLFNN